MRECNGTFRVLLALFPKYINQDIILIIMTLNIDHTFIKVFITG